MADILQEFDDGARTRVREAVGAAEARTSAEILPVVAKASDRYDRAEDIVGLWTGGILGGLTWLLFQGVVDEAGPAGEPAVRVGFWILAAVVLAGFVGGVVLADRLPPLRRLFVPAREMRRTAVARAKVVFLDHRVYRTAGATGVLLYVSLLERIVVVLADDAIAERLSERALGEVRDEVVTRLRHGDLASGLAAGAERLGALLEEALPAAEGDEDELPSEVVVLD